VNVFNSNKSGPTILVLGGVHGDEINGVELVRSAMAKGFFNKLRCGAVIAVPLLNVFGFINFSRDVPDGKDVNRSFPGRKTGSLASRVAYTLTQHILPHVDVILDFHTGGATRYNHSQIRFTKGDEESRKLADIFGAPYKICINPIPKSLRRVARERRIPTLVYEGGESLRYDDKSLKTGLQGIKRILNHFEMRNYKVESNPSSFLIERMSWVRASRPGLFMWKICSGKYVKKGEIIGLIRDPYGIKEYQVKAPRDGHIIGHNNASVVGQGDALFHIGYPLQS
jgi:predicted deacylase